MKSQGKSDEVWKISRTVGRPIGRTTMAFGCGYEYSALSSVRFVTRPKAKRTPSKLNPLPPMITELIAKVVNQMPDTKLFRGTNFLK